MANYVGTFEDKNGNKFLPKTTAAAVDASVAGNTSVATVQQAINSLLSMLVKSLTVSGTTITITKGDGTTTTITTKDTTYSNFVKSGSTAKAGLVPAPPTTAGTTKYLREDGTWQVPPDNNTTYTFTNKAATLAWNTAVTIATVGGTDITVKLPANPNTNTWTAFKGATASAAGTAGYLPAPAAGDQAKFFRADGTWVVPTNTNNATAQNISTDNNDHPILLGNTANATANIGNKATLFGSGIKANPSTSTVTATTFVGKLTGNADTATSATTATTAKTCSGNSATATQFSANKSVTLTGDVTGTASSKAGWAVATTLANSGVTAGSYGPSANATPAYGATFNVPYITVDAKGRITAASTKTVKIPASDNTNTIGMPVVTKTGSAPSNLASGALFFKRST